MSREKALKRINEYLAKQQPQKVELALTDDLKKLNTTYYRNTDTANSILKGLLSEARKVEAKIDEAIKSANKMDSLTAKVEKTANDLGVNPNNIKELQDAKTAIKDASEYKQILSTIKKFISSI
tara:strand:+ start:140 stop:511 length:372 start_codon:yes stop_codon:yes gene_type:complete